MNEKTYKETLDALVRLAHEQKNLISEADYVRIMGPLSMTEEQDALTRAYLKEIRIRFAGEEEGEETTAETETEPEASSDTEDGNYLSFYLESLKELKDTDEAEQRELFERVKKGDAEAAKRLTETFLYDVAEIAGLYVTESLTTEDIISEGNLGLIRSVGELQRVKSFEDMEPFLTKGIMDAIDEALSQAQNEKKDEDALIKKLIKTLRKGKNTDNEG